MSGRFLRLVTIAAVLPAAAFAQDEVGPEKAAPAVLKAEKGESLTSLLDRALEVRGTNLAADIEIVLEPRGYALRQDILIDRVLQPRGCGRLTFRCEKGKRAKLLGSQPVTGWKKLRKYFNGRSDVWEADVSQFGFADYVTGLFFDGKIMTLARYPNFDPKYPYAGGWAYVPGNWISMYSFPKDADFSSRYMPVDPKDWHDWKEPKEGRIVIFPRQRFGSSYVRIGEFDREAKKIIFASRLCDQARPKDTYILSGFREELDVPGEFCHVRDGDTDKLYLISPEGKDPNKSLVTVTLPDWIVRVDGAENVSFEGIDFMCGKNGVRVNGGSRIRFEGCHFHDLDGMALALYRGRFHEVRHCDFHTLGGRAAHIIGGSRQCPNGIVIDNCYIHHVSRNDHAASAFFVEGAGFTISHCLFHDLPQWAIFHSGNWGNILDNRIHHYMLETEDGGAYYTCNYPGGVGTVLKGNWVSDGVGFGKAAGVGPYTFQLNSHGFYFDTLPGGALVTMNVLERISCMALKMDGNRCQIVTNNVFNDIGTPGLLHWSYDSNLSGGPYKEGDDATWESMTRNDPFLKTLPAYSIPPSKSPAPGRGNCWSNILVRNVWNIERCPNSTYLLLQGNAAAEANVIDYNYICVGKESKCPRPRGPQLELFDWKDVWQRKFGADVHTKVVSHIHFKDPERGNFGIKDKVSARQLGLVDVDVSKAGLYPCQWRKIDFKEAPGAAQHPEWYHNRPEKKRK